MPRASRASLTVLHPNVSGRVPRLSPPDHLNEAEKQAFRALVSAVPASHFRPSDEPLLCEYCVAVIAAREAAARMTETGGMVTSEGVINRWFAVHEKLARRMAVFAMRLRLTPASRTRPESVARRAGYTRPSYYDHMDDEDA
jgi:phage terminase small subunit